jgi:hypothetical protein
MGTRKVSAKIPSHQYQRYLEELSGDVENWMESEAWRLRQTSTLVPGTSEWLSTFKLSTSTAVCIVYVNIRTDKNESLVENLSIDD